MEFRTRLVISRRNIRAYVAYAGMVIAACALPVYFIPPIADYYPYVFGAGIAIIVIGAVIARGDVRNYGFSQDELVVSPEGITMGAMHYPLRIVSDMDFNVEAYNGLYMNDGSMVSGSKSDGMTNGLTFRAGGAKVDCGFYLESKEHVQQLGMVFDEFYRRRVPFVERNRSRRTYLFQHLNERELAEFRARYGYR